VCVCWSVSVSACACVCLYKKKKGKGEPKVGPDGLPLPEKSQPPKFGPDGNDRQKLSLGLYKFQGMEMAVANVGGAVGCDCHGCSVSTVVATVVAHSVRQSSHASVKQQSLLAACNATGALLLYFATTCGRRETGDAERGTPDFPPIVRMSQALKQIQLDVITQDMVGKLVTAMEPGRNSTCVGGLVTHSSGVVLSGVSGT
jgi:hypothetical protein